ncbi:hypothetical protein [Massilia sp. TSP1-1-2]|uniref:hypothetical protein n=1 Tax=Massilia sp. TSP1-1-2 TaxID=2804649 RepID=UPI003CE7D33B
MKKTILRSSLFLLFAATLAACSSHQTPPAQASPAYAAVSTSPAVAPVIVNAAAPAQSGGTDMLAGGAIGYMLAKSTSGPSGSTAPAPTTVVHKTVINKTIVQAAPTPTHTVAAAAPAVAPVSLAKATPSYASRSAYASTTGSSAYRTAASPVRQVSYSLTSSFPAPRSYTVARR